MARIRVTVSMGLVGCKRTLEVEVDDEDLREASQRQRTDIYDDAAVEAARDMVDVDWELIEEPKKEPIDGQ
jgi:hypothetical protein